MTIYVVKIDTLEIRKIGPEIMHSHFLYFLQLEGPFMVPHFTEEIIQIYVKFIWDLLNTLFMFYHCNSC